MDYQQRLLLLLLLLVAVSVPVTSASVSDHSGEVLVQETREVVSQGEQQFREFETQHRIDEWGGSTLVQHNVKINTETSVRHHNEDKVLLHHPHKGQRQRLNKHGNVTRQ